MKRLIVAAAIAVTVSGIAARADEVEDTLNSALSAYQEGDLQYALEELEFAKQLMLTMKTDALSAFLPEAPDGWTREINSDINASLGMMGGGVGAEAKYTRDGESFTLSIMADNPMVGAMSAMLGNAAAMGMKVERVGREKFAVQDNTVQGLIDSRILVKAEGGEVPMMLKLLEEIDFRELSRFGN